ncbi:hypothetical protein PCANC_05726 [Puccinia coronata f. sp. avenae]|uniref:TNFR-Cys domain-containing protein n=1 Tax=Puccinia coronata f. sp. avenae TaxID=200324 RepID=A0A2N5TDI9_9BASI|nr:hypothetical protein PCASD_09094 [Puccinia coronata f. sp. avenae]PLW52899.1 hypothetical protein PCANC_05726 [Puccinia coronata f. sp. avenae]
MLIPKVMATLLLAGLIDFALGFTREIPPCGCGGPYTFLETEKPGAHCGIWSSCPLHRRCRQCKESVAIRAYICERCGQGNEEPKQEECSENPHAPFVKCARLVPKSHTAPTA